MILVFLILVWRALALGVGVMCWLLGMWVVMRVCRVLGQILWGWVLLGREGI